MYAPTAVMSVKLIVTRISDVVTPLLVTSRVKILSSSLTVKEEPVKLINSSVVGGRVSEGRRGEG